ASIVLPTVSLLPPSSEQLSGGSASLACLLTGYSPQGALVIWEVDGLEVSQGVVTSPEEEKEGLYRRSSTLTLNTILFYTVSDLFLHIKVVESSSRFLSSLTLTCHLSFPPHPLSPSGCGTSLPDCPTPLHVPGPQGLPGGPTVSLLPPSSEQLSGGSASLACLLTGYSPQGALVSWEVDGLEVSQGVVTSPEEEKEGLYRRSSTLTLSKAGWEQGELYTCRVSHFQHTQASPLPMCLEKVINKIIPGPTVSPTVSLLPPSSEQLSGGSASLACLLTGYSPQGALVSWEVDGLEVSQGVVTSPEEEKEGLYRRSSTLTLSKAGWEQGELYTCRVSHFKHTQASPLRRSQCLV
uniref:Ig-like domain-containing protein n=1 Tax=Salmo trutta TaxID=8032 RepID=A0A673W0G6_SALTR